jgi:HPt (histidine-containing phosphotransfer) domain-containing protein
MSTLLDAEAFDVLVEAIGAEATRAVVELFLGESRDLVAAIAAPGADPAAVGRAAHSLKSSAGQLGASALSAAALAVENAAHAGGAELPQLSAALADCAAATQQALAARLS